MATYYVKNGGNDGADGLSDANAWASISQLNSFTFSPMDFILFNRGDIWTVTSEYLTIDNSGAANNRITWGSYGEGVNPIITGRQTVTGWNTAGNWTNTSGNIWSMANAVTTNVYSYNNRGRLWLNGTEVIKYPSNSIYTPNLGTPWTHNAATLYVYATSNPATFYSNIEFLGALPAVLVVAADYITIQNLDIRGSGNLVQLNGADSLVIENCNIGRDCGQSGVIIGGTASNNVIIRNNIFDTFDHNMDTYEMNNTEDGIITSDGCDNWNIYGNTFTGWGHTAFDFGVTSIAATNIKFHNNTSTCPNSDYGRCFTYNVGASVTVGTCVGNEIYNNLIYDHPVKNQISGDGLKFYNNIIDGVRDTGYRPGIGQGLALTGYGGTVINNEIYNNVIMNCTGVGLEMGFSGVTSQHNIIKNNILINNDAANSIQLLIYHAVALLDNTWQNNLLYKTGVTNLVQYGHLVTQGLVSYEWQCQISISAFNGYNGLAGDIISGNIGGDPMLVGGSPYDYSLQSGSPAIGAGINVNLTTDYAGNVWNTPPSIGAYEYGSSLSLTEGTWLANRTTLNTMFQNLYSRIG